MLIDNSLVYTVFTKTINLTEKQNILTYVRKDNSIIEYILDDSIIIDSNILDTILNHYGDEYSYHKSKGYTIYSKNNLMPLLNYVFDDLKDYPHYNISIGTKIPLFGNEEFNYISATPVYQTRYKFLDYFNSNPEYEEFLNYKEFKLYKNTKFIEKEIYSNPNLEKYLKKEKVLFTSEMGEIGKYVCVDENRFCSIKIMNLDGLTSSVFYDILYILSKNVVDNVLRFEYCMNEHRYLVENLKSMNKKLQIVYIYNTVENDYVIK